MFQVIDLCGYIYDAYGTFIDKDGDVQFVLCDSLGKFYKTDSVAGYYRLYSKNTPPIQDYLCKGVII